MDTLRWSNEVRSIAELNLPASGKGDLKDAELAMAQRLVDDMTEKWDPEQYKDTYTDDLMARIEKRIKAGEIHVVARETDDAAEPKGGAR